MTPPHPSSDPPAARARGSFVALLVVGYLGIGLSEGTLGVAWPSIRATFDRPVSGLGLLLALVTGGYLAATLLNGRLARRFGIGRLLVAGALAFAVGALGYASGSAWGLVLVGSVLIGAATGLSDGSLNAHVAVHHPPSLLRLMHGGFGIGATLGPLVLTAVLHVGWSWRWVYAGFAAIQLVLATIYFRRRHRWETESLIPGSVSTDEPDGEAARRSDGTITVATTGDAVGVELLSAAVPAVSRRGLLVAGIVTFFFYTGVEASIGSWSYTLLTDRGAVAGAAGVWVTLYWASLTAGRFALGALGRRVSSPQALAAAATAGVVGTLGLWLLPHALAPIGLVLAGVGLAGAFPALVALTPARLGAERVISVMGWQLAAASLGVAAVPAMVGVLAQRSGLSVLAPALVGTALAFTVATVGLEALSRRAGPVVVAATSPRASR